MKKLVIIAEWTHYRGGIRNKTRRPVFDYVVLITSLSYFKVVFKVNLNCTVEKMFKLDKKKMDNAKIIQRK